MNPHGKTIRYMSRFNANPRTQQPMRSFHRFPNLPAEIRQIIWSYALTHNPARTLTVNDYLHEYDRLILNHDFLSKSGGGGGGRFPRIPVILDSDMERMCRAGYSGEEL